jgi:hypothetical protein
VLEAQATVEALRLENQALAKRLSAFTQSQAAHDDTFVTTAANVAICDHCGQEVPKANYQMHYVRCVRVNQRCEACSQVFPVQDLKKHMETLQTDVSGMLEAAENGDLEMLEARLAHGMDIHTQGDDPGHNSALHACARGDSLATAQFLISRGADVNLRNSFGETPLHLAVAHRKPDNAMVAFLLSKGADPLLSNKLGDSAYALAMRQGDHTVSLMFTKTHSVPVERASLRPRSASSFRQKTATPSSK